MATAAVVTTAAVARKGKHSMGWWLTFMAIPIAPIVFLAYRALVAPIGSDRRVIWAVFTMVACGAYAGLLYISAYVAIIAAVSQNADLPPARQDGSALMLTEVWLRGCYVFAGVTLMAAALLVHAMVTATLRRRRRPPLGVPLPFGASPIYPLRRQDKG